MVPIYPKDCNMLQLKAIVNGMCDEEVLLQEIKTFEAKYSLKKFDILTKIQDLLPLATSLLSIKQIVTVFVWKLISLLDELEVFKSTELSQECSHCVKNFWSLCSCQQSAVTSSQMFGRWDAVLVESILPLASIMMDLFIVAHQDKEKRLVWSKKLYSCLTLDLPDRAVKLSLLEITCDTHDGVDIVVPILKKVLSKPFDEESNADYLLHFLLLKKWQAEAGISEITKKSKFLKAPASFLDWLKTYWKEASDYIPDDKSLKGALVSQFLLDLDMEVMELLTDVLQMAIFPENNFEVAPDTPLFVVDKKGKEKSKKKKQSPQEEGAEPVVTTGRKRSASEILDSPQKNNLVGEGGSVAEKEVEITSSPQKKKAKKAKDDGKATLGFVLDRGPATAGADAVVQIDSEEEVVESDGSDLEMISDDEDEEKEQTKYKLIASEAKQKTNPELVDDEDDDDSASENDDVDADSASENIDDDDSHGSDIIEIQDTSNLAAAVLRKKKILISDPVASSYFQSGNRRDEDNNIQVFEIIDDDNALESSIPNVLTKTKVKGTPRKNAESQKQIQKSPKTTPRADDHVKEISESIASHYKKSDSAAFDPFEVNSDSSDSVIVGKQTPGNSNIHSVYSVTVDEIEIDNLPQSTVLDKKQSSGSVRRKSMEEDIATKLSAIRKSTPSAQLGNDTPTRRSTRLQLHSDREESTPSKRLPSSASVLKNWLRPTPSKTEMKNAIDTGDDKEKEDKSLLSGTHSMTKIKVRNYSETNSPPLENGSVKSNKVNPTSSAKETRSRRSVQARQLTDKHDATPKSKRTDPSSSIVKPSLPSPSTTASQHHDDDNDTSSTTKLKENPSRKDGSPSKSDKKSTKDRQSVTPKKKIGKVEDNDSSEDENPKAVEKTSKKQPPKSNQRRKSEPASSVTKGKVVKKDESHSTPKSAKASGKSRTTSLSAVVPNEANTKEDTKKTPSGQRSRNLSSKTLPSQSDTVVKKSPGPSPGNRRKSLRSSKKI